MKLGSILAVAALTVPIVAWLAIAQAPPDKKSDPELVETPASGLPDLTPPPSAQQDLPKGPELPKQQGEDKKIPPPPPGPEQLKDPTAGSQKLKDLLNLGKVVAPGQPAAKMPNIVLRGRIISKGRPPAALLEMDGRIYVVAKDSILPGPGNITLRVDEINSVEVRIEVPHFKEMLSLR